MQERLNPIQPGDSVKLEGEKHEFIDSSADIFNNWVEHGKPLPFVSVKLVGEDGTDKFIHVTEIDKALSDTKQGERG